MKLFVPFLCGLICAVTLAPLVRAQEKKDFDALLKDLDSTDREVRLTAVTALADLGPDAGKAAKALAEFLTANLCCAVGSEQIVYKIAKTRGF